jgi:hypothetical protein
MQPATPTVTFPKYHKDDLTGDYLRDRGWDEDSVRYCVQNGAATSQKVKGKQRSGRTHTYYFVNGSSNQYVCLDQAGALVQVSDLGNKNWRPWYGKAEAKVQQGNGTANEGIRRHSDSH